MNKIIFALFIFVLLFSPLAFGTVETWSLTVMESFSFLALFLLLLSNRRTKDASFHGIPGLLPLICLLIFIGLQLVPLPPGIVRIISPATYAMYRETIFIDAPMAWVPLTISKKATLGEFFRMASYVAFYALTVQLLSKKENLKKTVTILVVFASLLSLFAILQHFLPNGRIYWIRKLTQGGSPFGPYVNRNHYAGLMEMIFPLVLGIFLYHKPHVPYQSLRDRITGFFNLQRTNIYLLLGFSAVLVATSVFLTLSRSGIVSLCVSMICFGGIFLVRGKEKKRGLIIAVIFVLIVLSVGWFGWNPILERFETIRNPQGDISELRLGIWRDSGNIIRDFPLFGTGIGSFINIYPRYRTVPGEIIAGHAHSDYLEILTDGGVIALLLFAWFLLALLTKSYRVFLKRRETYSIYLFIAAVSGIVAILVHGFTDFNLRTGANGLYFFFLSGLAVSAANTRLREGLNDTYLPERKPPLKVLSISLAVLLAGGLIFHSGVLLGKFFFSSVKERKLSGQTSRQDLLSFRESAYRASLVDPLEAQYHYAVANIERLLMRSDAALAGYRRAVRLNPVNGEYLQRLGLVMAELKNHDLADKLLRAGISYDAGNPVRYRRYASWLFSTGRKEEGMRVVKTSVSLEPRKTREYITIMVLNGLSDADILASLPELVEPHLHAGNYLSRTGNDTLAMEAYLRAAGYMKTERPVRPTYFYEISRFYVKKGMYGNALSIMREAVRISPDNVKMRLLVAGLYEKLEMPREAIEEYRHITAIEPGNREAKKRIDALLLKAKGL
jgi:O-antigen ligase/Flp pilus assembly protein TadD